MACLSMGIFDVLGKRFSVSALCTEMRNIHQMSTANKKEVISHIFQTQ